MSKTKKKLKQRGDSVILRTKKNEPNFIIDWLNSQSNISESLRHLIEKDVAEYGIRDVNDEILNKHAYGHTYIANTEAENQPSINQIKKEPNTVPQQEDKVTDIKNPSVTTEVLIEPDSSTKEEKNEKEPTAHKEVNKEKESKGNETEVREKGKSSQDEGRKVKKRNIDINKW
ncbi:hypothetical protein [Alkalihalobacillus sp. BA299]|uniref:hypothetical protein n=1 Tax=Alkalihalobacillus sp. BA299 TaxID=2815938 RepID=UPI001AD9F5FB|nr:hypothetical protein [Alkalihalobacillus sp. BA299]